MKPRSVDQAERRLLDAREAFADYCEADSAADVRKAQRAWARFLAAAAGPFAMLEQGAKCCTQCSDWYGRVKGFRKTDPLLSYLHHARNSTEHSIEEVSVHAPQRFRADTRVDLGLGIAGIEFGFKDQRDENPPPVRISMGSGEGPGTDVTEHFQQKFFGKKIVLLPITDRGRRYAPPAVHRGAAIADTSPGEVGRLALTYLQTLIAEARELDTHG